MESTESVKQVEPIVTQITKMIYNLPYTQDQKFKLFYYFIVLVNTSNVLYFAKAEWYCKKLKNEDTSVILEVLQNLRKNYFSVTNINNGNDPILQSAAEYTSITTSLLQIIYIVIKVLIHLSLNDEYDTALVEFLSYGGTKKILKPKFFYAHYYKFITDLYSLSQFQLSTDEQKEQYCIDGGKEKSSNKYTAIFNELSRKNMNLYKILDIQNTISTSELHKTCKKLKFKYHPDKNIQNKEAAEEMFKKINQSCNWLQNTYIRKLYDEYLSQRNPKGIFNGWL